ncbi:MAG: ribosome maturation factor RimP [Firmicutes bacterium]|nr:ribosome maturation factor RimP [Bacillota bacterium]
MSRKKGIVVDHNRIEKTVWQLAEPFCSQCGCELIDVEFVREASEWYLRLFIDREPAVDHDLCEQVSRLVSDALDIADPISQSYYLEVSSPGLERPLKREEDFQRYAGEKIAVRLYAPLNGKKDFCGILRGLADGELLLEVDGGELRFPLDKVAKAHLVADI